MAKATAGTSGGTGTPKPGIKASGSSTSSVHRVAISSGMADFARPEERGLVRLGAQAQMAVRVLQANDRAVHQRADRQGQPGQRHHVDRLPQRVQAGDGPEHGDRNGHHGDQRHPPFAEEDENHQRAEDGPEHAFLRQALDRLADVDRLIHHHLQIDVRRGQPRPSCPAGCPSGCRRR